MKKCHCLGCLLLHSFLLLWILLFDIPSYISSLMWISLFSVTYLWLSAKFFTRFLFMSVDFWYFWQNKTKTFKKWHLKHGQNKINSKKIWGKCRKHRTYNNLWEIIYTENEQTYVITTKNIHELCKKKKKITKNLKWHWK